jgi:hypothetical protein
VKVTTVCAYEELRRIGRELTVATADTGIPEKIPKNCPYARMKAREKEDAFTL